MRLRGDWPISVSLEGVGHAGQHRPSVALTSQIRSLGYRLWWHKTRRFNASNFAGETVNEFDNEEALNLLCVPADALVQPVGLHEAFGY